MVTQSSSPATDLKFSRDALYQDSLNKIWKAGHRSWDVYSIEPFRHNWDIRRVERRK